MGRLWAAMRWRHRSKARPSRSRSHSNLRTSSGVALRRALTARRTAFGLWQKPEDSSTTTARSPPRSDSMRTRSPMRRARSPWRTRTRRPEVSDWAQTISAMSQLREIREKRGREKVLVQVLVELDQQEVELGQQGEEAAGGPGRGGLAKPVLEVRIEKEGGVAAEPQEQHIAGEGGEDRQDRAEPLQELAGAVLRGQGGEELPGALLEGHDLVPLEVPGPVQVTVDEEGQDAGLLRAEVPVEQGLLDLLAADRREGEMPAAGADGRQQQVRAVGQQDDMGEEGGLFEDLEQGVGGFGAHGLGVVDDEHAGLAGHRAEISHLLDELGLLDLDLLELDGEGHDVGVGAVIDGPARGAVVAGVGGQRLTVEGLGQGQGHGPLADPFRAAEDEGVRDASALEGQPQDLLDPLVAGDVLEGHVSASSHSASRPPSRAF